MYVWVGGGSSLLNHMMVYVCVGASGQFKSIEPYGVYVNVCVWWGGSLQ